MTHIASSTLDASPQSAAPPALLDPRALAAVSRLELVAKQVMDGYVQGMHKSPHVGFALDFAQHRQYAPGDDIKRIDWRVYAKADRYYIKQYEVTTNLKAYLVVDASGSMAYRGAQDPVSKFHYATLMATCLAYVILHQQDSAGLITFDQGVREFVPPRSASSHLFTLIRTLEAGTPSAKGTGDASIAEVLHHLAERIGHRHMVIVLSDFFDNVDRLLEALHHLRHNRHEVLLLQIMAEDELSFPFKKFTLFESLETAGKKLRLDPAAMRATYLENLARHMEKLRDGASALRIDHALFKTSQPLDRALSMYLARRMGSR